MYQLTATFLSEPLIRTFVKMGTRLSNLGFYTLLGILPLRAVHSQGLSSFSRLLIGMKVFGMLN